MVTEELQDPGITQVYTELMTHGGCNTYSSRLPDALDEASFGACQTALRKRRNATLLAAHTGSELLISPRWHTTLPAGSVLCYIGEHRLTPDGIVGASRAGRGSAQAVSVGGSSPVTR